MYMSRWVANRAVAVAPPSKSFSYRLELESRPIVLRPQVPAQQSSWYGPRSVFRQRTGSPPIRDSGEPRRDNVVWERRRPACRLRKLVDCRQTGRSRITSCLPVTRRVAEACRRRAASSLSRIIANTRRELLPASVYFKPSFFPAAISAIDSRMRLSRVSGRLAV